MDVEAQAERAVFLQVVGLMLTSVASCFLVARIPEGVIQITGRDVALFSESPLRKGFLSMAMLGAVIACVGFALTPRWPFRAQFGAWWRNEKCAPGRFERLQYAGRMSEMAWLPGVMWVPFARAGVFAGLLLLLLGMRGSTGGGDAAFVPFLIYLGFWWMYQCCYDLRYPHWFFGLFSPVVVRLWARQRARRDPGLMRVCGRVQAVSTVACPLTGDPVVVCRSHLRRGDGLEREYVIHDRATDFDLVTDDGDRFRVRIEDLEFFGPEESVRQVQPLHIPEVWRRRVASCTRRSYQGRKLHRQDLWPRLPMRVSSLRLCEGDRVEVIGALHEAIDESASAMFRGGNVVRTLSALRSLPLLLFKQSVRA